MPSRMTQWRRDNPEKYLRQKRRAQARCHGMTLDEYEALLAKQGGVCAICGQEETITRNGTVRALVVDHDHQTGRTRGILCSRCNTAIGFLGDDPDIVARARAYLLET